MIETGLGVLLGIATFFAGVNVYQSYENYRILGQGRTFLAQKLKRAHFALLLLEISSVFLFAALFVDLFIDPQEPNEMLTILILIVLSRIILKLGIFRENYLFKKQLESLIEFNKENIK